MLHYRVTGNQLNNSALNITTNGAPPETIDGFGTTQMNISLAYGDTATVNLADHSQWVGLADHSPGDMVRVAGKGTLDNTSSTRCKLMDPANSSARLPNAIRLCWAGTIMCW